MQEDLKRYSDRLRVEGKLPLQARVGVDTGEVVVRSIKTGEDQVEYPYRAFHEPRRADAGASAIGSIAATQLTQRLCEGYFTFKPLGPTVVKGVSEPAAVFEVSGLGAADPFAGGRAAGIHEVRGPPSRVGTDEACARTRPRRPWPDCRGDGRAGGGQVAAVFEFKAVAQSACLVLEGFGSRGKASAYLPVIDCLELFRDPSRGRRTRTA